jgi:hypothetical protein
MDGLDRAEQGIRSSGFADVHGTMHRGSVNPTQSHQAIFDYTPLSIGIMLSGIGPAVVSFQEWPSAGSLQLTQRR